jgi:Protein of unknown function (DUF1761)
MASLNWTAIILITLGSWAGGALWFGPIFGKLWMRIHHGDRKFSDSEMKQMTEGMWKLMVAEIIATLFIVVGLAYIIRATPEYSGMQTASMIWAAFILPVIVSTIIWGNDAKKWMVTKIIISSSYRLIALLAAGYILSHLVGAPL